MGLSIHYRGRFNQNAVLSDLITEVKEVAEVLKWNYTVYGTEFPTKGKEDQLYDGEIYGISFTPPDCETVSICFLSNYVLLKFYGHDENQSEIDFLYMVSVKTQFAGPTIHKTIVELFRYLFKKNYFSEFDLVDEGEYWETCDEKLLEHKFKEYGNLIDSFSLVVETTPVNQGELYENYFKRIIKLIDKKGKKN